MVGHIKIYSVFHLNMLFSSIEVNERPFVIERCYWPLLHLIEEGFPLAIEASGLTLEYIQEIDPQWIDTLSKLIAEQKTEFVGSGYAQIIGPLVPHSLLLKNLHIGLEVYDQLLGVTPSLVLVNEQAYSPSLVNAYLEVGYKAILMDWANPYSQHIDQWAKEWLHYPQRAMGLGGASIPLIWLDSIPFQKFQRYAHGEIDGDEILNPINNLFKGENLAYPLYGNDAEIFDFRPGRYATEPRMLVNNEWERIHELLIGLRNIDVIEFVHPSEVIGISNEKFANHKLQLETPNDPIPVKKQPKYNISRWAATGRDDVALNTACWRIFNSMIEEGAATQEQWIRLCKLWSSDFRTHITENRWRSLLEEFFNTGVCNETRTVFYSSKRRSKIIETQKNDVFQIIRDNRHLVISSPSGTLKLRLMKGLAIEGLWPDGDNQSIIRTIPHGYFDDITWGADYFSGHLIAQIVGRPQVTDLELVAPEIFVDPSGSHIDVEAYVPTALGPVFKQVRFFSDQPRIEIRYRVDWMDGQQGSIHFGNFTLNPAGFNRDKLFYAVHNGGDAYERHDLLGATVDHMRSTSFLCSARSCLGMTEGRLILGDDQRQVLIECPRDVASMPAMVTYVSIRKQFFCRVALSAREIDDTNTPGFHLPLPGRTEYMMAVTALTDCAHIGRRDS